ncbi:MAG: SIR2 family protein [Woeseiaceae bacterium]|nr:SIR2 family protein [Woeseiaceae bacterium]
MKFYVLLGAGFSHNWGGWLANEVLDYLIGCPEIDRQLKRLLLKHDNRGGFEAALSELQERRGNDKGKDGQLDRLENAVIQMFCDMNRAFSSIPFEFSDNVRFSVAKFLARFDSIFTLNQDLLLEKHYLNENISLLSDGKWNGWAIPGTLQQYSRSRSYYANPDADIWMEDADMTVKKNHQPYIKLHGSSNWYLYRDFRYHGPKPMLVIGGGKQATISKSLLRYNFQTFEDSLCSSGVRLMIVGYGFADSHINDVIHSAATENDAEIFVVDPLGIDAMRTFGENLPQGPNDFERDFLPQVIGASRRKLSKTFGGDVAEHQKIMRFFEE